MKGQPTDFWGKLKQDDDRRVLEWHPLADHCADVAAVCEALLERTLLRRRSSGSDSIHGRRGKALDRASPASGP
ncbi:MAG: HD domain-containing protein [Thermoanaerobaculia bacterium]